MQVICAIKICLKEQVGMCLRSEILCVEFDIKTNIC